MIPLRPALPMPAHTGRTNLAPCLAGTVRNPLAPIAAQLADIARPPNAAGFYDTKNSD